MAQDGILVWANTIRTNMKNDPGRKYFQEQIQSHGFQFLLNYLEEIEGAGNDPVIELLKTPARNRASPKKPRAPQTQGSRLKEVQTVLFSEALDKENKKEQPTKVSTKHTEELTREPESPRRAPAAVRTPLSPRKHEHHNEERSNATTASTNQTRSSESHVDIISPHHAPETEKEHEPQDLFVIEEDDETANLSRTSLVVDDGADGAQEEKKSRSPSPVAQQLDPVEVDEPMVVDEREKAPIPEEQPAVEDVIPEARSAPSASKSRPPSAASSPVVPEPRTEENLGYHDEIIEIPLNDEPERGQSSKNVTKLAYHPLRKSVRAARDTSLQPVTPGAGLGGKRTSWLVKLREQKALEVTKAPAQAEPALARSAPSPRLPSTSKRKSDDLVNEAPRSPPQKQEDRKEKKRKLSAAEAVEEEMDLGDVDLDMEDQEPLEMLKKQVRNLKNSNKSLGGEAVANALAEAKAAAKARVAEKEMTISEPIHRLSEEVDISNGAEMDVDLPTATRAPSIIPPKAPVEALTFIPPRPPKDDQPSKAPVPSRPASTTSSQPVFSKPVFVPKAAPKPSSQEYPRSPPPSHPTPAVNVGLSPRLQPSKPKPPVSAQSTTESIQPDSLFDDDIDDDHSPGWMQGTQDTEYTNSQQTQDMGSNKYLEEDDSMALEDAMHVKSGLNAAWSLDKLKDDTWSDQTESTRTGTHSLKYRIRESEEKSRHAGEMTTGSTRQFVQHEETDVFADDDMDDGDDGAEDAFYEDTEAPPERPTIALVQTKERTPSPPAPTGFFSHASKLVSSVWGSNKKTKPEVKSLQLAAAAAKKQQGEKDKKASRLKDMDLRRQQAIQRKADEEKARALEDERKAKEEAERRRREKEEQTMNRSIIKPLTKKDDDTKKRKPEEKKPEVKEKKAEVKEKKLEAKEKKPEAKERKPELKKTTSKLGLNMSSSSKPTAGPSKSALKATSSVPVVLTQSSTKLTKTATLPSALKGKGKVVPGKVPSSDDDTRSKVVVQKSVKVAAMPATPLPPTESIELPDINSEYSDSDDEDRKRTFDPPQWAQSPELIHALQQQSTINPDDIFGTIQPLKMEEIFRSRTSRFRARTSSANWTGSDMLTEGEKKEYTKRMGYQ